MFPTLIISDLHIGSKLSRSRDVLAFLSKTFFKRLILLGDVFADLDLRRLGADDLILLSYLVGLTREKEIVFVEGNHDAGMVSLLDHLTGISAHYEYNFLLPNGKKCVALHGHQFDDIVSNVWFANFISWIYLEVQKVAFLRRTFCIFVDKLSVRWQRLTEKVAHDAIEYAIREKVDFIFCGHTHETFECTYNGVHYYNTGSWVGDASDFILITENEIAKGSYEEITRLY